MKQIICKKNFSRSISIILSFVLVLTMVIACIPLAGAKTSNDGYVYLFNEDGTVCIWGYTGSATELTIPRQLDGRSVTRIGERAFYENTELTSVTIPNSIIYIGKSAFEGCKSLTGITIPDSVTRIGERAFWDCTLLSSITIPDGITFDESNIFDRTAYYNYKNNWIDGVLYIGNYLYEANDDIISEYTVREETKVICGGAFWGRTSLTDITIPDSVTEIGYSAFDGCTSLTNVIMSKNVKEIGLSAFEGCKSLTSITIPNGVTKIKYATFIGCESLKDITIPKSVTVIDINAFAKCTALSNITIPDSVTEIGYSAFDGCTSLTNVIMSKNVKKIGFGVFEGCKSLTSITIPNGVTELEYATFRGCESLKSITVPASVTKIGNSVFSGCPDEMVMYVEKDSFAQTYAIANNIKYSIFASSDTTVYPTKINLNKTSLTLGVGETFTLSATPTPSNAVKNFTWSTSNSSVISVNNNGKLTANRAGSAVITVKSSNGKTATCNVTVKPAATKVYLNKSSLTLGVGETFQLTSWCEDGTYSAKRGFGSSNNNIVYTSGNGKLTAKKVGTATITVKTFNGKTATCKVTVKPAATKVYLNKSSLTLGVGETFQLTSWCEDGTYSAKRGFGSSNNNLVYTSGNGKLTAKKVGTATITVKTFNGKTATCKVTVKPAATKVYLNKSSLTLGVGETFQLTSWCEDGTYSAKRGFGSSNNNIVYTSGNGKLTAKKVGTATITVKTFNGKTATCNVTVKPAATKVYLNKSSLTLKVGETYRLMTWCENGTYSAKRDFNSSDDKTVSTSGNGTLTAKKRGTATITVKTFNGKTATCKVTVK